MNVDDGRGKTSDDILDSLFQDVARGKIAVSNVSEIFTSKELARDGCGSGAKTEVEESLQSAVSAVRKPKKEKSSKKERKHKDKRLSKEHRPHGRQSDSKSKRPADRDHWSANRLESAVHLPQTSSSLTSELRSRHRSNLSGRRDDYRPKSDRRRRDEDNRDRHGRHSRKSKSPKSGGHQSSHRTVEQSSRCSDGILKKSPLKETRVEKLTDPAKPNRPVTTTSNWHELVIKSPSTQTPEVVASALSTASDTNSNLKDDLPTLCSVSEFIPLRKCDEQKPEKAATSSTPASLLPRKFLKPSKVDLPGNASPSDIGDVQRLPATKLDIQIGGLTDPTKHLIANNSHQVAERSTEAKVETIQCSIAASPSTSNDIRQNLLNGAESGGLGGRNDDGDKSDDKSSTCRRRQRTPDRRTESRRESDKKSAGNNSAFCRSRSPSRLHRPEHSVSPGRKPTTLSSTKKGQHSGDRDRRRRSTDSRSNQVTRRRRSRSASRDLESRPDKRSSSRGKPNGYIRRSDSKKEGSPIREKIDKQKLYEIAKKNVEAALRQAAVAEHCAATGTAIPEPQKAIINSKSIGELVDYCRTLQKKPKTSNGANYQDDDDEDSDDGRVIVRKSEDDSAPFHHPFALKSQPANFVFNVKNVTQIPIRTPAERVIEDAKLRVTFPVSSGEQHREKESDFLSAEWTPVVPPNNSDNIKEILPPKVQPKIPPALQPPPFVLPPPPQPPVLAAVISTPSEPSIDISEVVSGRLRAQKRLEENPYDIEALQALRNAEAQMKRWATSKQVPGLFTGSTGAVCLTPEQLAPIDQRSQAWSSRSQASMKRPIEGGVGMSLMQKMGWRPGEGLGKNKEGGLEPLQLDIKSDRKGLVASEESTNSRAKATYSSATIALEGKHPVSALLELCTKRKWSQPTFSYTESGPPHDKRFLWNAVLNGVSYQPAVPSANKKNGKAQVCQVILHALGFGCNDESASIVMS